MEEKKGREEVLPEEAAGQEQEKALPGEAAEREKTLEELQEENRRLQEENERLNRSIKERIYDKIPVSVRTMDIFIVCMCVLFVIVVILGMRK